MGEPRNEFARLFDYTVCYKQTGEAIMRANTLIRRRWLAAAGAAALATGSPATADSAMTIELQVKHPEITAKTRTAVVVDEVIDRRQFTAGAAADGSGTQATPNPDDTGYNSRLVGQLPGDRRGSNYLVLEGGQTVAGLVGDAVAEALRRAGYRVVGKGHRDAAAAPRVRVELDRFWIWSDINPEIKKSRYFNAEIDATIEGGVAPFAVASRVGGDIRARGKRPEKEVSWIRTGNRGIEDFVETVTVLLRYPPAGAMRP